LENIVLRKVVGKAVIRLIITVLLVFIVSIVTFVFFSSRFSNSKEYQLYSTNIESKFQINEWSHWLIYYDEVLTQSARNFAYSQDIKWKKRYDATLVDLYRLISLILRKSKNQDLILFKQFDQVNTNLAVIEEKSFKAIEQKEPQNAIKLLDSKEYQQYKLQYQRLIQNYLKVKTLSYKDSFNKLKKNTLNVIITSKERTAIASKIFLSIIAFLILVTILLIWFMSKRIKKITMFMDQIIVGDDFSDIETSENNDLDIYVKTVIQTLRSDKFVNNKHFTQEMSIRIETLRNEFKRNLHDRLGVLVSATKLHFYFLKPDIQKSELTKHYDTCLKLLDQTYNEIKQLSNSNDTHAFNSKLVDRINALISFFKSLQEIEIQLEYKIEDGKLSHEQKDCIELIIREALNNIINHAKSKFVSITILDFNEFIEIIINDDGIGFQINNLKRVNGINYMEQRVENLQGKFEIFSSTGNGTLIKVRLPIK